MPFFENIDDTSSLYQSKSPSNEFTGEELSLLCDMLVPLTSGLPALSLPPTSPVSSTTCDDLLFLDQLEPPPSFLFTAAASSDASDDTKKSLLHCSIAGCPKRVRSRGLCKSHGGGRRCSVSGWLQDASRAAKAKAYASVMAADGVAASTAAPAERSQMASVRTTAEGSGAAKQDVLSRAKARGSYCRTHGGGKLCKYPGCKKGSQRKGYCATHGHAIPVAVDVPYETYVI
ncbi:hypothetical protein AaE_007860 [Aphanomyces astaci]|uniref:Uncharacterized protein n=1 Tax=Aphanomyces astaci TaxID=112090 RepID=A0A6A5A1I8_APHAT|nr:hypothetical protein AaE_007860 [Aphanomyces astaci]